ncbi:hypothetical protein A2368_00465 [Candidatus Collierbacteria bacterium RIFOXYB1_FULL_49_13]|uniref:Membrane protein 6-pyruvoyl-tetrahydropterin synthase-related domain-containing protein n=1 Tax=Candidatus Collierbacteria bacterium RIFOXYB1_FULL_49_13 TaxID=1817728 RepID=A0A1F5FHX6_9BACT|nr:MAG: hypothetical protein A2368_00465 [Candidatus Collierbacteria bacterium RIFOXYB1_FULL_49_13]
MRFSLVLSPFLLLTFFLFRPMLGSVWYPTHDTTHITRLYLMEQTIKNGQFPPIWAEGINQGYGYPLFHFYAPLLYYLALPIKLLTGSPFTALKLVLFLSSFLSMVGMYYFVRRWGRGPAIFSALAFGTLPYFALNLYVRGAYAEFLSMSLLPWLFLVWENLSSHRRQVLAAGVTALFLLSHNLIPLITAPFLLVWVILRQAKHPQAVILPALLTIMLSAFYLLPLLFERSFVQADAVAVTTDYALHFVSPTQLWNSAWGFGGSAQGIEDGMSFKLGKLLILLSLSSLPLLFFRSRARPFMIFFVTSAIVAIFLTTFSSSYVWDQLKLLQIVQFPWRFLSLVGFFLSVLAGLSLTLIRHQFLQTVVLLVLLGALFLTNLKLFVPQTTLSADLSRYTSPAYLSTVAPIVPEYMPAWMLTPPSSPAGELARAYYPTWKVLIDGQVVPTAPSAEGYLTYPNPTNSTDIKLIQFPTPLEKFSYLLTLVGLITLLIYVKI